MGLCPLSPLDLVRPNRLEGLCYRVVIPKYHQVIAGPTGRRSDETVEFEKDKGCAYLLRSTIVSFPITSQVYPERGEISPHKA